MFPMRCNIVSDTPPTYARSYTIVTTRRQFMIPTIILVLDVWHMLVQSYWWYITTLYQNLLMGMQSVSLLHGDTRNHFDSLTDRLILLTDWLTDTPYWLYVWLNVWLIDWLIATPSFIFSMDLTWFFYRSLYPTNKSQKTSSNTPSQLQTAWKK